MNTKEKIIFIFVLLVLLASAWFFRWEITPVNNGEGLGAVYKLNRWTGQMYLVRADWMAEVTMDK